MRVLFFVVAASVFFFAAARAFCSLLHAWLEQVAGERERREGAGVCRCRTRSPGPRCDEKRY